MATVQLNEAQQAAVAAPDGPALVLAGAGSGKTRVIIERMAWLVEERGVAPRNLLALTFTNKAAGEMRNRFAQRVAMDHIPSFIGTFHSFGLWVLRRNADLLHRPKNFTIFDDQDQVSLIKRMLKELPKTFKPVPPREALGFISRIKQIEPYPNWSDPPESPDEETCRELWGRYHDVLKACGAVDFDDLTALTAFLLERFPEVRDKYRQRFNHVLVDEYQDTNRSQYIIARCLGENSNIFVVGDEDQSIYSWRGADINNILDFARDFPNARVFRLEQNYRSAPSILDAANAVVAHNVNRLGKRLFSEQEGGVPVSFFFAEDADVEANFVAEDIARHKKEGQTVAVFYRVHVLARLMEEALRTRRMPYIVVGGIKFYSRKEIKDIIAYLRLLVNPADDESLRRILNVPARGIGETGRAQLVDYAALRGISLTQALREIEMDAGVAPRTQRAATELADILDELHLVSLNAPVAELVEQLLDRVAYRDYVERSDEKESRNRIEVVNEFVVACSQYDARAANKGLAGFLEELALISDVDALDEDDNAITLMTCHCAKGLEFDHVYIIGLEEEMFPMMRYDDDEDIEEERRLCYVAMTRARKRLTLAAAETRMLYGVTNNHRQPSRFIEEIGEARLRIIDVDNKPARGTEKGKAPADAPDSQTGSAHPLKTGDVVRHARFGRGVVLYTKGAGSKFQARIRFDSGRHTSLMVAKAPIEIVK